MWISFAVVGRGWGVLILSRGQVWNLGPPLNMDAQSSTHPQNNGDNWAKISSWKLCNS